MKSNTNIMFNYIKKQKGDFVVPIEINTDNFLAYTLEQYLYKKNRFKKVKIKNDNVNTLITTLFIFSFVCC